MLGVPRHELYVAAAIGAVFGVAGYFVTRAAGPHIAAALDRVNL